MPGLSIFSILSAQHPENMNTIRCRREYLCSFFLSLSISIIPILLFIVHSFSLITIRTDDTNCLFPDFGASPVTIYYSLFNCFAHLLCLFQFIHRKVKTLVFLNELCYCSAEVSVVHFSKNELLGQAVPGTENLPPQSF